MGLTHVAVKLSRPGGRRALSTRLLVDTGAVFTVLPEPIWRRLRLKPEASTEFLLADGSTIARPMSECRFAVAGRSATSPVVLGEPGDAALLGAVTLETLRLMVNPLSRKLMPMRLLLGAMTA